jgi:hypothetical protein
MTVRVDSSLIWAGIEGCEVTKLFTWELLVGTTAEHTLIRTRLTVAVREHCQSALHRATAVMGAVRLPS